MILTTIICLNGIAGSVNLNPNIQSFYKESIL